MLSHVVRLGLASALAFLPAAHAQDDLALASVGAAPREDVPRMPISAVDDYFIGPYDLLEISVFQVDDLSRTVRVNARGTISLPMVGTVQAMGLTARDVEDAIAARLAECCLHEPQVTIFIKEFVSQRVTLEGEVSKPGVYPLSGRTTLLQAVAMASGVGALASESDVTVFRSLPDGRKEQLVFDLDRIREGKAPDPDIRGNDVVVVGKSSSRAMVKGLTDTLRGFIGFGTVR